MANGLKGTPPKHPVIQGPTGTRPSMSSPNRPAGGSTSEPDPDKGTPEKLILGKYKTQADFEKAHAELEKKYGEDRTRISRLEGTLESLQGVSDFIEMDPVTGQARVKMERIKELADSQDSDKSGKDLKERLLEAFKSKSKEDPGNALMDLVFEAAEHIATKKMGNIKGDVDAVRGSSQLTRYLSLNPHDEVLVPYVHRYFQKVAPAVRSSIELDDAFEVVKAKLKKAGRLEEIGYEEEESVDKNRRGDKIAEGDSGGLPITKEQQTTIDEAHDKIRGDILGATDALDAFLAGSNKSRLKRGLNNPEA